MATVEQLELHPAWEELTDRQRAAISTIFDEVINPLILDAQAAERRCADQLAEAWENGHRTAYRSAARNLAYLAAWRVPCHDEPASSAIRSAPEREEQAGA